MFSAFARGPAPLPAIAAESLANPEWTCAQTTGGRWRSAHCGCVRYAAFYQFRQPGRPVLFLQSGERLLWWNRRVQTGLCGGSPPGPPQSNRALRRSALQLHAARGHAQNWRPLHRTAVCGQMEMTAATAQTVDRVVSGSVRTTSSLCDLLANACPRAGRQSQNADESFRVLLVVAVAHSERRKIGAVEREFRLASGDGHIAFIQFQRDCAGDFLLCLGYKAIQGLAQRSEPQAVINQFCVLERDVLLEMQHLAIQAERFQFAMSGKKKCPAGSLITAARLDADKTVFYQVHASNGVASGNFIEQLQQ